MLLCCVVPRADSHRILWIYRQTWIVELVAVIVHRGAHKHTHTHTHTHTHPPKDPPIPVCHKIHYEYIALNMSGHSPARRRSPAPPPPPLPTKDYNTSSSSPSASSSSRFPTSSSSYINVDLANAIRDSVVVNSSNSSARSGYNHAHGLSPRGILNGAHSQSQQRSSHSYVDLGEQMPIDFSASPTLPTLPSVDALYGAGEDDEGYDHHQHESQHRYLNTLQEPVDSPRSRKTSDHSYSYSTQPGISSTAQPQLPSQRIMSAANPFEQDEMEPPPAVSTSTRRTSTGPAAAATSVTGGGSGGAIPTRTRYTRAQTAMR